MLKGMIINKEGLLKAIKEIRTELKRLNGIGADAKLACLQRKLSEDLKSNQKEFQMYDKVRIISVDRDPEAIYPYEYLHKTGWIVGVDKECNYPYAIEIEGEVTNSIAWRWKAENLQLIERA